MNTINITIENTVMHPDSVVAGYAGDNLTTTLSIELPDSWRGYSYRLLFKTSMQDYNDAYITDTIQPEGGHILFPLPSAVMVEGKLQVQARAEKDSGEIAHAAVMSLDVLHSIGTSASGDFPPSYVGLMDNALNHLLSLGAWYPPKIVDGYWWAYDATADDYANTGVNAQGLNSVTEETETALTGILKGNGETVVQAVAGTDYAIPEQVNAKQNTITAQGILKGDGSGGVSTAAAGTDYATPAQLEGKLDKTGGTINGALDIANAGSLKFLNPNMQGMMLKTNVDGVVCEATPGTDYDKAEIGTWTPVLQGYSGTAPTVSYSSRYGDYMKIGNMVWFRCGINATISNAGTGYATVSGLPFAAYPMAKNRANYAVTVGECYGLLSGATSTAGTTSTVFASINAIVLSGADGNTMRKWAVDWGSIALSGFYITN